MTFDEIMKKLKVSKLSSVEADELRSVVLSPDFPENDRPWILEAIQILELSLDG